MVVINKCGVYAITLFEICSVLTSVHFAVPELKLSTCHLAHGSMFCFVTSLVTVIRFFSGLVLIIPGKLFRF